VIRSIRGPWAADLTDEGTDLGLLRRGRRKMIHLEHLHTTQPISKPVGPRIVAGSQYHQLLSPVRQPLLQEIVEITSTSDDIVMMPGEAPFDQSLDRIPKQTAPQQHSVFRAEKSLRQRVAADPLGGRLARLDRSR
jgi:hypothetical protein